MSIHPAHSSQAQSDQPSAESLMQRYLRSPLLISWSKLKAFFQHSHSNDLTDQEAEQPFCDVYFAQVSDAPEGIRVQGQPFATHSPVHVLHNGDEVAVFFEPAGHEQPMRWVRVQSRDEENVRGWVEAEMVASWTIDHYFHLSTSSQGMTISVVEK